MNRREAREQAFIFIFEKSFNADMSLEELVENAQLADDTVTDEFAERLFNGVYDNIEEIDAVISNNLNGWTINRISRVTLCLLRLAAYQMQYCDDIPVSVAINESVELAKKFASEEDASYLNGVLGSISRS